MKYLISILFFTFCLSSYADEVSLKFEKANDLYLNQEYDSAISIFQSLYDEEYSSQALLFNLGNSYLKGGQLAKAILYYEKGLKLNPANRKIEQNLNIAYSQTKDIQDIKPFSFKRGIMKIILNQSNYFWYKLGILFTSLAIILYILYQAKFKNKLLKLSIVLMIVAGIFFSILGYFQYVPYYSQGNAIVMSKQIEVFKEADLNSNIQFNIHEGSNIKILSKDGKWLRISFNDNEGYILNRDIEMI